MKLQRMLLNTLSLGLLVLLGFCIVQNWSQEVVLQGLNGQPMQLTVGLLLLLSGVLSIVMTGSAALAQFLALGQQQKRTSRELERREVSHEEAAGRVKALENKILTLEKALQEALKK